MNKGFYDFLGQLMKILKKQSLIYALGITSTVTFVIYVLQNQLGLLVNYNIFILFLFILFITIAVFEYKYRPVKKLSKRKGRKMLKGFMKDDNKRKILEKLYHSEGNPIDLDINNGNVSMLEHSGMIYVPTNLSTISPDSLFYMVITRPYVLTPFAEKELKKYENLNH